MFLSKKHIPRRSVLKGAGVSLALPLLDAMIPASTAWADTAAGKAPKRFAFVGFPHGAIMAHWSPAETGTDYAMSPILEPLTPLRKHLTIVSGLRNKTGGNAGAACLHRARLVDLREAVGLRQGRPGFGRERRPDRGSLRGPGHSPAFAGTHHHHQRAHGLAHPTQPLPQEGNPRAVFQKLFGPPESGRRGGGETLRTAWRRVFAS